jgi:hypothetical protein
MLKYKTYAENLRMAAKTADNPQKRPLSIRDIANISQFSYEHIRKLWMGKTDSQKFSVSKECNQILCQILGLPEDEMLHLSEQEKFSQKAGYVPMQLVEDPEGRELSEIWNDLDKHQHAIILEMARSFKVQQQHAMVMR